MPSGSNNCGTRNQRDHNLTRCSDPLVHRSDEPSLLKESREERKGKECKGENEKRWIGNESNEGTKGGGERERESKDGRNRVARGRKRRD